MMGVSHAYSGLALGCAVASLWVPHPTTILAVAAQITAPDGDGDLATTVLRFLLAAAFVVTFGLLLPGFLVPDPWIADAPALVLTLFVLILGGSALMPDLDHVSSTVARTLGPITGLLSNGLNRLSLTIYHATRLDGDPPHRADGHRLITHTWPGSAGFAVVALVCQLAHPIAAGVVVGISAGLLAVGIRFLLRRILRSFPRCFRIVGTMPGITIGTASGLAGWHASVMYPGWSLLFPLAVFLGCVIHREGDWCTNSGVPRRLWGIPEAGGTKRWAKHGAPRRFDTGKDVERYTVRPMLLGSVVVSLFGTIVMPIFGAAVVTGGAP